MCLCILLYFGSGIFYHVYTLGLNRLQASVLLSAPAAQETASSTAAMEESELQVLAGGEHASDVTGLGTCEPGRALGLNNGAVDDASGLVQETEFH